MVDRRKTSDLAAREEIQAVELKDYLRVLRCAGGSSRTCALVALARRRRGERADPAGVPE